MAKAEITTIPIDVDVPIPEPRGAWTMNKYPFGDMSVGNSFFVAAPEAQYFKIREAVSKAVQYAQRTKEGYRFTTRHVDGGIRVWRIA